MLEPRILGFGDVSWFTGGGRFLQHLILPTLGSVQLRHLDPDRVRHWYSTVLVEDRPTERKHAYSLLRSFLRRPKRRGSPNGPESLESLLLGVTATTADHSTSANEPTPSCAATAGAKGPAGPAEGDAPTLIPEFRVGGVVRRLQVHRAARAERGSCADGGPEVSAETIYVVSPGAAPDGHPADVETSDAYRFLGGVQVSAGGDARRDQIEVGVRRVIWVAAISTSVAGVLGGIWFALLLRQPMLGFEDTDNPAVGVRFVREHPDVFAQTGLVLILMAMVLVVAVASVAELHDEISPRWPIHAASAAGMFAAMCFLVFGAMRIGASGPLLHIAGLRQEWGEGAYLAVHLAGVQGVLPAGLLALAAWAVALSAIGLGNGTIPPAVCLLGMVPAIHVLGRIFGQADGLPEGTWLVLMLSIPGTLAWCLALGIGLMTRLRPSSHKSAQPTSEVQP